MYEGEKVQTQGRSEPAEEGTREEQCVPGTIGAQGGFQSNFSRYILVTLMIGCQVVVVEDADVEDGVVGTDAHVADG